MKKVSSSQLNEIARLTADLDLETADFVEGKLLSIRTSKDAKSYVDFLKKQIDDTPPPKIKSVSVEIEMQPIHKKVNAVAPPS